MSPNSRLESNRQQEEEEGSEAEGFAPRALQEGAAGRRQKARGRGQAGRQAAVRRHEVIQRFTYIS